MNEPSSQALYEALRSYGAAVEAEGELSRVGPGGWLEAWIEHAETKSQPSGVVRATLVVRARSPHSPGIFFDASCSATGHGDAMATLGAAQRWADLAYPSLHSAYSGHDVTLDVEVATLPASRASGAWRIHAGAVIETRIGPPAMLPPARRTETIALLLRPIAAAVVDRADAFALDLFVGKSGEGEITTAAASATTSGPKATRPLPRSPRPGPSHRAPT